MTRDAPIAWVDIETTGTMPHRHAVLSIGVVRSDGQEREWSARMTQHDPTPILKHGRRWANVREPAPNGYKCQTCKAPATHRRRDCIVGGGHTRNVYYCAEHDYAA